MAERYETDAAFPLPREPDAFERAAFRQSRKYRNVTPGSSNMEAVADFLIPKEPWEYGLMAAAPGLGWGGMMLSKLPLAARAALLTAGIGGTSSEAQAGKSKVIADAIKKLSTTDAMKALPEEAATKITVRPPGMGHNMPPEEFKMAIDEMTQPKPRTWAQELPRPQPARRSTEVPDIRELPVEKGIEQARKQSHLIKAGEQSEGYYVGGPRDVMSKKDLNALRKEFDEYIAADPRGGDWYDRYRAAMNWVTGGDPNANLWSSAQQGQWSAGVDPGSELQFVLREKNSAIAGMPEKAGRPAPHAAHLKALETQSIDPYQLGEKTGEYARLINPDQAGPPGATGVNDFRHARNWRYTEQSGAQQRNALTDAQHKFLDYETALAVDRANKEKLGGRGDWTGEQLQAAPWVRQKALDIMSRNKELTYDQAFERANKTMGDFFPKHRAFATYEAIPGTETKHLPGMQGATAEERAAFTADPRGSWQDPKTGRDLIYGGMGTPGTGSKMYVEPTVPTQGIYQNPRGEIETNPGSTALPLISFKSGDVKSVPEYERRILNAAEATRGLIDAQNASAWHKPWIGGKVGESNSWFVPKDGPSNVDELMRMREIGARMGLGDVVDTGKGITMTQFYGGAPPIPVGGAGPAAAREIRGATGIEPVRAKVDSGYIGFEEALQSGKSGAATREALQHINVTPEIRAALNSNPAIPQKALGNLERDAEWSKTHGMTSEAYTNLRRIIGEGPGWVDRIEAALKAGTVLPAVAAALFAAGGQGQPQQGDLRS